MFGPRVSEDVRALPDASKPIPKGLVIATVLVVLIVVWLVLAGNLNAPLTPAAQTCQKLVSDPSVALPVMF